MSTCRSLQPFSFLGSRPLLPNVIQKSKTHQSASNRACPSIVHHRRSIFVPSASNSSNTRVYTWGANFSKQLGYELAPKVDFQKLPRQVSFPFPSSSSALDNDIRQIACGSCHCVALTASGEMWTWGLNKSGQLGHSPNQTSLAVPQPIESIKGLRIVSVACGSSTTLALSEDGRLFMWGSMDEESGADAATAPAAIQPQLIDQFLDETGSRLPFESIPRFASISAGHSHAAAITENGHLFVWGNDRLGTHKLGFNDSSKSWITSLFKSSASSSSFPRRVVISERSSQKTIATVGCGLSFSVAIARDGCMYVWGDNHYQQLAGTTSKPFSSTPLPVSDVIGRRGFRHVSCGYQNAIAVSENGDAFVWGLGEHGNHGLGYQQYLKQPQKVEKGLDEETLPPLRMASCGWTHSALAASDGSLWTAGGGQDFALGHGDDRRARHFKRVEALKGMNVTQVSCGLNFSMCLVKER